MPAHINNMALKYAWDTKWKKESDTNPPPKIIIITPNWLRVDRAIIFFMSISNRAARPAIIIVNPPNVRRNIELILNEIK